jgi:hypothetical protein
VRIEDEFRFNEGSLADRFRENRSARRELKSGGGRPPTRASGAGGGNATLPHRACIAVAGN